MADSCIECARNAVYYETTKLHELCDHQRTTYHRGWLVAAIASWAAAAIMMIGWALVVL